MHLAGLDLNLLVALDALLAERNVTRAARRVGLSQSAMSHALARMRQMLDDPLLVRTARGMAPTPRAEALARPLRDALGAIEAVVAKPKGFDPRTASRVFRISAGDLAELVLFPPLLAALGERAPGFEIDVPPSTENFLGALARAEVDVGLGPVRTTDLRSLQKQDLFSDHFVCIVREGHPLARGRLTLDRYVEARHAMIAPRGTRGGVVDDRLAELGRSRRVVLQIPHFLVAPFVVAQSDLVLTLPARVASVLSSSLPLRVLEPPLDVPGFSVSMIWHERSARDPAHAFLREQLVLAARSSEARATPRAPAVSAATRRGRPRSRA